MGTPASLLDLIARGGSMPGFNESQQAQANVAQTQAQTANLPIQGRLTEAQTQAQQAAAERTQLENRELQRQIDAAKKMAEIYSASMAPEPASSGAPPPAGAPADAGASPSLPAPPPRAPALPNANMAVGTFLKAGYTYPEAVAYANKAVEYGKNALTLNADQRDQAQKTNDLVGQKVAAIEALPVEQRAAAWAQTVPDLAALDHSVPWQNVDPANTAQLEQLKASHLLHSTILGWSKTGQEITTSGAQGAEAQAAARQKTAEAAKLEYENGLVQRMAQPGSAETEAELIAPAAQYPDINRQLRADLKTSQTAAAMQEAKKTASSAVLARTPQTQQAKADEAALVAKSTNPYEISRAQTLASYNHSLQQGDTVRADYFKSLSDMQSSLATADTIHKVLDLSKSGNAVAGAQLKAMVPEFTNAVQNIRRMAASQGDKGLASTADHLSSETASLIEGKPLSDAVQNAIGPYVQTIANGATTQHNATVQALRKAYPNQAGELKEEKAPYQAAGAKIPEIASQADYDQLPKGAQYTNKGVVHTKQ